ncbi:hypothetical protein KP12_154 [Klebsiella phage KP12]|uniref:Uncharacterized protein n=2 Tax=Vequintavirinae TaxID=1911928 RepID=A0A0S1S3L1_9CAUD|nr:hypothetical protein KB57_095 [Klebsiella phage vB_KpnM_KB57]ALM02482.1 hypothetical protein KB57_095 [Klebsiella phage vB_KpnM_KB57]UNI73561.1 hypothetical protein KP12_154 [Klebsiella phage KP12]WJJ58456.1 hypothetical protein NDO71_orf090 [Klebsiella phage vB_KpnM_NDO71]WPK37792.1 hypothetical protein [Escherichia phage AV124]
MEIKIGDNTVNIRDGAYVTIPTQWLFDDRLSPQDLQRLIKLWWRYDYFKSLNPDGGDEVFYPSQKSLCHLFGLSEKSQPKVSEFLTKMESLGYIRRIRSGFQDSNGNAKPRHYIIVNRGYMK